MDSEMLKWMRVVLRFLQFSTSLVALVVLSSGFVVGSYYGYTSMLGSSPVIYTTLMTYTGMVYGLWFLVLIEVLGMCSRPVLLYEQLMDLLLAVMLLIAAIVLLCSDYVQNCGVYGYMLRCRAMNTAVVFTFIAMATFVLSLLLSFCENHDELANDDTGTLASEGMHGTAPYEATASTPTGAAASKSPVSHV